MILFEFSREFNLLALSRRRPIFSKTSLNIFGPGMFNFSVRNGKRWDHTGIITEIKPINCKSS